MACQDMQYEYGGDEDGAKNAEESANSTKHRIMGPQTVSCWLVMGTRAGRLRLHLSVVTYLCGEAGLGT